MKYHLSQNHFTACLLGGAISDAFCAPIEFLSITEIRNIHGPEGLTNYCEFADCQGEFTDDIQIDS